MVTSSPSDNTNRDIATRREYVEIARKYKVPIRSVFNLVVGHSRSLIFVHCIGVCTFPPIFSYAGIIIFIVPFVPMPRKNVKKCVSFIF